MSLADRAGMAILVMLFSLILQPPSVLGAQTGTSMSANDLTLIIREATTGYVVVPELSAYALLQGNFSNLESAKGTTGDQITAKVKVARGKYIVIEHKSTAGSSVLLTEVITYSKADGKYFRWRLVDGKPTVKLAGVGSAKAVSPNTEQLQTKTIHWTTVPDPTAGIQNQLTATETIVLDAKLNRCRHTWTMKVMRVGMVIDRQQTVLICQKIDHAWPETQSSDSALDDQFAERKPPSKRSSQRSGLSTSRPKEFRFEEQNFQFKDPRAGFVKSLHITKGAAPSLRLLLNRRTPEATIAVFAEKVPIENAITIDQVVETALQRIRRKSGNSKISPVKSIAQNGIVWEQFTVQDSGPAPITLYQNIALAGGYIYQILVSTGSDNPTRTRKLADRVIKGFELIDQAPLTRVKAVIYEDPQLGIKASFSKLDFPGLRKATALDLKKHFPAASFWGLSPDGSSILVFPVDHGENQVSDEVLRSVVSSTFGLTYPDGFTKVEDIECGVLTGTQMTAVYPSALGATETCVIRVFPSKHISIGLVCAAKGNNDDLPKTLAHRLDAIELKAPSHTHENSAHSISRFLLVNDIGILYSQYGDWEAALPFFQRAHLMAPNDITVGTNLANTLATLKKHDQSLELTQRLLKKSPLNAQLPSIKGVVLRALDRKEESIEIYQRLADQESMNEDDLILYLSTLVELDRASDALAVTDKRMNTERGKTVSTRRWHSILLQKTGKIDESIRVARQLADDFPDNVELAEDVVIRLIDSDRFSDVIAEVATLKSTGVTSATLLYNEGLAYLGEKDYSQAKSAFEEALVFAPGDATLLDAISQTSAMLGQGDNSAIKRAIEPVPIPASVSSQLTSLQTEDSLPTGFSYQTISHVTGIHFKRGQPLRSTDYRELHLLTKAGVDDLKTLEVSFDPVAESIFVNELSVLDPQGKVVAQGRLQDYYITTDTSQGFASSDKTLNLPVPGLKPGHTLRYCVTRKRTSATDSLPFKRYTFASGMPSGARAVFVSGDIDELKSGHVNGPFVVDRSDTVASWVLAEPPMFYLEGFQPSFDTFLPNIWMAGKADSWEVVGTQYLEKLNAKLKPSSEAAQLARQLTETNQDATQKSLAILKWVERETVYQALEFGVRGQIPNDASQTIHNRFGDCKDLSLLAWQMLKSVGVDCHLALVQSYGDIVLDAPTLDQFNHMILYLPDVRGGCFVDCTSRDVIPWRSASTTRHDRKALVLAPSNVRLQTIPAASDLRSTLHCERDISISDNQRDLYVDEKLSITGPLAASFRSFLRQTNSAELNSVLQSALASIRRINVDLVETDNVENLENPVVVRMKYKIPRAIKKRGSKLLTNLPVIWEKYCFEIDASSERKTPFELETTLEFVSTTKLRIPTKLSLLQTPDSYSDGDDWTNHNIRVSSQDGNLVCRTKLLREATGLFPAEKYESFLDSVEATLDAASVPLTFRQE